ESSHHQTASLSSSLFDSLSRACSYAATRVHGKDHQQHMPPAGSLEHPERTHDSVKGPFREESCKGRKAIRFRQRRC
ncbi:unnamed protein product, partial [Urochloa humidicola]